MNSASAIIYTLREKPTLVRRLYNTISSNFKRRYTIDVPKAKFNEKTEEEPVIVLNEYGRVDIIGPPNSVSNLRPVIRGNVINETPLQRRLREMQDATQEWNQKFWANHNTKFIEERTKYTALHSKDADKCLTAEEMSAFYKQFLDENWHTHVRYNMEWYKKNFTILVLALQVSIEKHVHKYL